MPIIVSPVYIPSSSGSNKQIQIELCKILPSTQQQQCLLKLQEKWHKADVVQGGILLVLVVLLIGATFWYCSRTLR